MRKKTLSHQKHPATPRLLSSAIIFQSTLLIAKLIRHQISNFHSCHPAHHPRPNNACPSLATALHPNVIQSPQLSYVTVISLSLSPHTTDRDSMTNAISGRADAGYRLQQVVDGNDSIRCILRRSIKCSGDL